MCVCKWERGRSVFACFPFQCKWMCIWQSVSMCVCVCVCVCVCNPFRAPHTYFFAVTWAVDQINRNVSLLMKMCVCPVCVLGGHLNWPLHLTTVVSQWTIYITHRKTHTHRHVCVIIPAQGHLEKSFTNILFVD